jgi:hypothetical protein
MTYFGATRETLRHVEDVKSCGESCRSFPQKLFLEEVKNRFGTPVFHVEHRLPQNRASEKEHEPYLSELG